MLHIALCDDRQDDREIVSRFLRSYFSAHPYEYALTEYTWGEALADDYEDGLATFDLIFLDIFMEGIWGMETARRVRRFAPNVPIVFLTTTPEYALESYDVRAYGYLMKPLAREKAEALLDRFLRDEYSRGQKTLLVSERGRDHRIPYREIEYMESRRNLMLVHTVDGGAYRTYVKLADAETTLSSFGFLRCHQSYLVNLEWVKTAGDEFIMASGARVPIRQRGGKAIRDACFQYLLERAELTRI